MFTSYSMTIANVGFPKSSILTFALSSSQATHAVRGRNGGALITTRLSRSPLVHL